MEAIYVGVIIFLVCLCCVLVVFVLKKDTQEQQFAKEAQERQQQQDEAKVSQRFAGVLSDVDIQEKMKKEKDELVTVFAKGTGAGIVQIEKLRASDPDNPDLLDWLAFMYYANLDLEKAVETYQKAIALAPDKEIHHYYLANSYYRLEMYAEAKKEWQEVIRLKPKSQMGKNSRERIAFVDSQLPERDMRKT